MRKTSGGGFLLLEASPRTLSLRAPEWTRKADADEGLVVDLAWRRRGIGKRLARAVERWALALGARWIELNVYEFNAEARRFYESLGYNPLSTKLRKHGPDAA